MRTFWSQIFSKKSPDNQRDGDRSAKPKSRSHTNDIDALDGSVMTSFQFLMRLRFSANLLSMPSAKRGLRQQSGGHLSKFRGRGMEFSEVRLYQPGDDIKSIDWRVTARRQKPHTKLFHEERERPVLIVCDQSSSQFFGSQVAFKSVKAAEIAALLAWTTLNHGDRVGGLIFSDHGHKEIRPARNRKTVTRFLKILSEFNQALMEPKPISNQGSQSPISSFTLENALQECRRLSKPGALNIIISDFKHFSPACKKLLHMTKSHGEVIAIQTFDALERELPPPGDYPVTDGSHQLQVNTASEKVRAQFKNLVSNEQADLHDAFKNLQIPLIQMGTEEDAMVKVQQHFSAGGLL